MTVAPPRPSRPQPSTLNPQPVWREWLICLGLSLVTLAAFLPVRHFGFISCDDCGERGYVRDNLHVQAGFTWESIRWAFTAFHSSNWHPVTWLSHILDCRLFGLRPSGHHVVNLLFHLANTLLLYGFLRHTTRAVWRSAMVAALFALHPLHIQSVAWISERKDVLSGFFFLLTLLAYAGYVRRTEVRAQRSEVRGPSSLFPLPSSLFYLLSLACCALGLMSKPMLVTVPFVLLLLDYWPLGRFPVSAFPLSRFPLFRQLLLEKLPFLALALASVWITMQAEADSVAPVGYMTLDWRVENALVSCVMYLLQTLWPVHLAIFYPLVKLPFWQAAGSGALLLVITARLLQRRQTAPELLLGWLWYLVMLLPVIGLVQAGTQARADRYMYLPQIGLLVLAVWGFARLAAAWPRPRVLGRLQPSILSGLAAVLVLTAAFALTRWQLGFWRDSVTLFTRVVELSGPDPSSNMFLGDAFISQSNYPAAADNYRIVLGFAPNVGQVHYRLGFALKAQGQWPAAETELVAAVRLDPADRRAGKLLGEVLSAQGKMAAAGEAYADALRYHPGDPLLEAALDVNQHLAALFEELRTQPTAEAHLNVAAVYEWQRNFPGALEHYAAAWRLQPDNPQLLNNYAWLLATCPQPTLRDGARAVTLAQHACELTKFEKAIYLGTLAAAQAQAGKFDAAAATAQQACAVAAQAGETNLVRRNQALRELYRAHKTAAGQ